MFLHVSNIWHNHYDTTHPRKTFTTIDITAIIDSPYPFDVVHYNDLYLVFYRRPVAQVGYGIGIWYDLLEFIGTLAVITNVSTSKNNNTKQFYYN